MAQKLNKNAQKWVKALRSGMFPQGKKALSPGGTYCCLGVACVLAVMEGVIPPPQDKNNKLAFDGNTEYLPNSVRNWLGLTNYTGEFYNTEILDSLTGKKIVSSLAGLNDQGCSFSAIADVIESQPEGLFKNVRKKK